MTNGSMETRLARYLLTYRVTPHSTTGVARSELLMNRKLSTQLDAVCVTRPGGKSDETSTADERML